MPRAYFLEQLRMRTTPWLVIFLTLGTVFTAVRAYSFSHFTEAEMKALALLQEEYNRNTSLGRADDGDAEGSCDCFVKSLDISCGCTSKFNVFGYQFEVAASTGLSIKHLELYLNFRLDDYSLPTIKIQPEICIPFPFPFSIVQICLGIYHADVCADETSLDKSSFKICLQADVLILIPIFSIDFNCLVYRQGKFSVDDTVYTDRPGLITYKLGHGFSLLGRSDADDYEVVRVGRLDDRIAFFEEDANMECERVSEIKEICRPVRMNLTLWS